MAADTELVDPVTGELVVYTPPERTPATLFRSDEPTEILDKAVELADTLAPVIRQRKLAVSIGNREHVLVEGWTMLGTMLGVFPVCTWTRKLEDGWEARVEVRTRDGSVVGAAEAQCTRTEKEWGPTPTRGRVRDDFALRSMAQTRATSKALRQPLGFVMQLAGFEAIPAEEISQDAGSVADVGLVAEVDARIAQLGPTNPSWTLDAVLKAASTSFGRPLTALEQMSDGELRQILEAMPK